MSQEKISCVVVQWRQKNVQNSVLYVQRCCFAYQTTFLFYFLSLFIYLSFFLFDVLESSLSGTLQNNEGDGNGNIKTIANT